MEFCNDASILSMIRIFGIVIEIIKIVIPLLIIVVGMIDFGKVVVSSDEKEINKATSRIVKRIVLGVLIYFIPTIVLALFDYLQLSDIYTDENFYKCTTCLLDTSTCEFNFEE